MPFLQIGISYIYCETKMVFVSRQPKLKLYFKHFRTVLLYCQFLSNCRTVNSYIVSQVFEEVKLPETNRKADTAALSGSCPPAWRTGCFLGYCFRFSSVPLPSYTSALHLLFQSKVTGFIGIDFSHQLSPR